MMSRKLGTITALVVLSLMIAASTASAFTKSSNPICGRLGKSIQASSGAQTACFGVESNTSGAAPSNVGAAATTRSSPTSTSSVFSANVDAATPSEDVTPAGVQAYGQAETSIASTGSYVVEGWNDATGFFAPCPSPMNKQSLTGFGFSADGGASFTDEGGLPNANCASILAGDPSVEAWSPGGHAYFYVASLFIPFTSPQTYIGLSACSATGSGSSARISCSQPIIAAASTQCDRITRSVFCGFLDKEYLTIDPTRGRLYVAYTEFGPTPATSSFNGQIELAVCDIGTPSGGTGPAGGTAASPVCEHGTPPSTSKPISSPYLTLAPGDPNCENEGVYPAVDLSSSDLYAAYEFNWASNILAPACFGTPTKNVLVRVPASCLVLKAVSPCSGPAQTTSENITSMDAAFIPGYNRFPASDFPRIAVAPSPGTVSMVWNDARFHPLGDILLRSYHLGTLGAIQDSPVTLNVNATGGLHFLPAVRNVSGSGRLGVSWYERSTANTALTDVRAALGVDPTTTTTPRSNVLVTSISSDWNSVSSDIIPNFGDYTDNYVAGGRLYVAWSDGRIGDPQPFEANTTLP